MRDSREHPPVCNPPCRAGNLPGTVAGARLAAAGCEMWALLIVISCQLFPQPCEQHAGSQGATQMPGMRLLGM